MRTSRKPSGGRSSSGWSGTERIVVRNNRCSVQLPHDRASRPSLCTHYGRHRRHRHPDRPRVRCGRSARRHHLSKRARWTRCGISGSAVRPRGSLVGPGRHRRHNRRVRPTRHARRQRGPLAQYDDGAVRAATSRRVARGAPSQHRGRVCADAGRTARSPRLRMWPDRLDLVGRSGGRTPGRTALRRSEGGPPRLWPRPRLGRRRGRRADQRRRRRIHPDRPQQGPLPGRSVPACRRPHTAATGLTAADVARVVLWLGSDANTSITGEVIREGSSVARTPLVALA